MMQSRSIKKSYHASPLNRIVLVGITGIVLTLTGCPSPPSGPRATVPGKATVEEAMAALEARAAGIKGMHAIGQCHMSFFDEEGKRRVHNISYTLRLDPPFNVYLQGQAAPGPQGLISMGSNAEEFWLSIRPEINTYWWGRWKDIQEDVFLQLSPRVILEALGAVKFTHPEQWHLTQEAGRDILTQVDGTGKIIKRIRVSTADYLIRNIMYFDEVGEPAVVVDLGLYKHRGGFLLPTEIQIANYAQGKVTDSAKFSIQDARERQYRDEQFLRHAPRGYDKVWQYTSNGLVAVQ